jgi:transcriptional regulator with XRE-family HTH domain
VADGLPIHLTVRDERERQGRRIADVARVAEVDPAHLWRFERGLKEMSGENLAAVLRALGLRIVAEGDAHDLTAEVAP